MIGLSTYLSLNACVMASGWAYAVVRSARTYPKTFAFVGVGVMSLLYLI